MKSISQINKLFLKKFKKNIELEQNFNESADSQWISNESKLPWLKLDIDIPHLVIRNEINNILNYAVVHRDSYGEHKGWKSFCIHGKSFDSTREDSFYNDSRPHIWTPEALNLMPDTVEFFKTKWPCQDFARLRVMILEPGGYISLHSDTNVKKLSPINIAITQPENCSFIMENYGIVPFNVGSALILDVSNLHCVYNESNEYRYHLIIHHKKTNNLFDNLIVNSYKKMFDK